MLKTTVDTGRKTNTYPLICGDLSEAVTLFDREFMTIESSKEAGSAWDKDQLAVKVRDRFDVQPVDTAAIIKGIVLRTYGAGNCPSEPWFLNLIHKATQRGLVIVNVTQCVNGGVNDTLYETGSQLNLSGVISGHDITCEAALTKLMYLFGLELSPEEVKKYMNCAICGEVSL